MTETDALKPPNFVLSLVDLKFPDSLDKDHANFRLIIELRYINDKSIWMTDRSVMPGLEDYWECDPTRGSDRRFVRNKNGSASIDFLDPELFDRWDRVALMVNATELFMCRVTVVDVDRQSALEKLAAVLIPMLGATLATAAELIPSKVVSAPLGSFADKLHAWLMEKVVAPRDKTLSVLNTVFPSGAQTGSHVLEDKTGTYELTIDVSTSPSLTREFREIMAVVAQREPAVI